MRFCAAFKIKTKNYKDRNNMEKEMWFMESSSSPIPSLKGAGLGIGQFSLADTECMGTEGTGGCEREMLNKEHLKPKFTSHSAS